MPNFNRFLSCGAATLALGFALSATPSYAGFQWVPPGEGTDQPFAVNTYTLPSVSSTKSTRDSEIVSPVIIEGTPSPAPMQLAAPVSATTAPVPVVSSSPSTISINPSSFSLAPVPAPAAAPALEPVLSPAPVAAAQAPQQMPALAPEPILSQEPAPLPILSSAPEAYAPPNAPVALPMPAPLPQKAEAKKAQKIDLSEETISIAISPKTAAAPSQEVIHGFASKVPLPLALRQLLPSGYSFAIDQDVDLNTLVSYKGGKSLTETLRDMLAPAGLESRQSGNVVQISRVDPPLAPAPAPVRTPASAPILENTPPLPLLAPQPVQPLPAKTIGTLALPVQTSESATIADTWSADRGDTLRKVLMSWCGRAGVELKWLAEYDYPIEASVRFSGNFEDAVRSLLAGFDGARPQPIGELHANVRAGQKVLVVQARGNNYSN